MWTAVAKQLSNGISAYEAGGNFRPGDIILQQIDHVSTLVSVTKECAPSFAAFNQISRVGCPKDNGCQKSTQSYYSTMPAKTPTDAPKNEY